jgi:hypothetical protein
MFSDAEIRTLSAANPDQGWLAIPHGCPPKFVQHICEKRARQIGLQRMASAPTQAAPKHNADIEACRDRLAAVSI